jgi:hypothetical protein
MNMKVSIGVAVVLLLGVAFGPASSMYVFMAKAAICGVAFSAALQAGRADRNLWLIGLVLVAVLFNPLVPVEMSNPLLRWVVAASVMTLIGWVLVLERIVAPATVADVLRPNGFTK